QHVQRRIGRHVGDMALAQVVEDVDLVAAHEQLLDDVGAYEAGAAGDQCSLRHDCPPVNEMDSRAPGGATCEVSPSGACAESCSRKRCVVAMNATTRNIAPATTSTACAPSSASSTPAVAGPAA